MADAERAAEFKRCASDRSTGDTFSTRVGISPPPLRRQRSGPENTDAEAPKPTALLAHLDLHRKDASRRHSEFAQSSAQTRREVIEPPHASERHGNSLSASSHDSLLPHRLSGQARHTSSATTPVLTNRPVCRVCSKGAKVKYDPLVPCNGCQRHYHDSCRKPSLVEGADLRSWRCFKCLAIEPKSTSRFRRSLLTPIDGSLHIDTNAATEGWPPALHEKTVGKPELVKPQKACQRIEEQAFQLQPPAHTQYGTPASLDGCGKHQDNVDEPTCLGSPACQLPGTEVPDTTSYGNLEKGICGQDLLEEASLPSNGPNRASLRQRLNIEDMEVTEIPNTPTQRSSQLEIPKVLPTLRGGAGVEPTSPNDSSMLIEPRPRVKLASTAALCSVCQIQRVLAKKGSTEIICQRCRQRSVLAKSGKTEIPNTPEASTSDQTCESSKQPAPIVVPKSPEVADQGPLHWFQTSLVATAPKIKQKKAGITALAELSCPPNLATDSINLFSSEHVVPLCHDADAPPRVLPRTPSSEPSVATNHVVTEESHRADLSSKQTREKRQPLETTGHQENNHSKLLGVPQSKTKQHFVHSAPSTFSSNEDNSSTSFPTTEQDADQDSSGASDAEAGTHTRLHQKPERSQVGTTPCKGDETSFNEQLGPHTWKNGGKHYTNRQLARIALVAANGLCMTTSQIILWLARTFPYLRVGEGNWEMNVRSALSCFKEFEGRKIPQVHRTKKLYGFSSSAFRAQFEAEHSEFLISSEPQQTSVQLEPRTNDDDTPRSKQPQKTKRAIKSAPSLPKPMTDYLHDPSMVDPRQQPSLTAKQADNDPSFNPFERSVPRQPFELLTPDNTIGHVSSMEAAMLAAPKPTIDTMTQQEKAQKIRQIQARPSRKAFFGSGHRLAHKRRYGLEDIHDERDGAWKPPASSMYTGSREADEDMDIDDEGRRTLREVFNLPDNMIPVNDGQTELAFKDGEKGKRSRTMYRVGKMFGGELTVRTS